MELPHRHPDQTDPLFLSQALAAVNGFESVSDLFAQMSDPSRIRIFWMLCHCEECVVNIAAMTSLVPVTGITLPLLSYGGTSMIFIAFAIGLVCQLSCYTSREVIVKHENISNRRRVRGAHHTSSRRRA